MNMAISRKRKRWLIITGLILSIFLILLLSLNTILSNKADSYIRDELAKVDTATYKIDFEEIRVNLFTGSVNVYNISIQPSAAAMNDLKEKDIASAVAEISVRRLKMARLAIFKALKGKEFNIGSLSIRDPEITVYGPGGMFSEFKNNNESQDNDSSDTVTEIPVKELFLNSFELENANFKWIDMSNNKVVAETHDLTITIDDLWMHHPDGDTTSHVLDLDEVNISLQSHFMDLPGGLYSISTNELNISYHDRFLSLDSLRLTPKYSKDKHAQIVGKQTDRFDLSLAKLELTGIEFDSLTEKKIIIDNIKLTHPIAEIYRDKRIARDMSIFPKLFQTSVALIPIPVDVKQVIVDGAMINYQERLEGAAVAGQVIFEQFDITVSGINNDPELIKSGQTMVVDGKAMFMGKAPLAVHMDLPIGNKNELFSYHGSLQAMDAVVMNPMIEHMAFVEAKEGIIHSAKFYGLAKDDTIHGRIEFLYNDLKVAVVKKQNEKKKKLRENKFLSALAGTVIIKNNPIADKPERICKMYFVRDPNKGFFNYIWKAVQSGLVHTLISGKKQQFHDMSWTEFASKWYTTLENDRLIYHHHKEKKKE